LYVLLVVCQPEGLRRLEETICSIQTVLLVKRLTVVVGVLDNPKDLSKIRSVLRR
jgi:hypothetical protein